MGRDERDLASRESTFELVLKVPLPISVHYFPAQPATPRQLV
jgi:hypothetical protein